MSYERSDYVAVARKQQFNIARTKVPPPVIRDVMGKTMIIIIFVGIALIFLQIVASFIALLMLLFI